MSFPKIRRADLYNPDDYIYCFAEGAIRKERKDRAAWARALAKKIEASKISLNVWDEINFVYLQLLAEAEKDEGTK